MKTIDEAAKIMYDDAKNIGAFINGVEFAQRWILVKDKLPEYGEYVLVKGVDQQMYGEEQYHVCEMNDLEDGVDYYKNGQFYWLTEQGNKITEVNYWRPIDLK